LDRAHKDGRFAISRDLTSSVILVGYAVAFAIFGPDWFNALRSLTRGLLQAAFYFDLSPERLVQLFQRALGDGMLSFLLCGFGVIALSVGVQLGLTKMRLPGRMKIDFARLSPVSRLKGFLGQNGAAAAYSVVLLSIVTWLLWSEMNERLPSFLALTHQPIESIGMEIRSNVMSLVWRVTVITVLIGAVDMVRQRSNFVKSLMMSKHEVRQEAKEQEGSPEVKMKIRRMQREIAKRRMMRDVPTATAVIVNPTHYAVAIRYNAESSGAPLVVAKGKDLIALRIRELALRHQVAIVENPPLARALYKSVEVGQEIPGHLYRAVAEILAYIYRLTGGLMPG